MSILTFSNLSRAYGDVDIFVGLNGAIPNEAKIVQMALYWPVSPVRKLFAAERAVPTR